MVLFEKAGVQNTEEVLTLALKRAQELDSPIVAASTMGVTALKLLDMAEAVGFKNQIVIVRGVSSKNRKGVNLMDPEVKKQIEARGAKIVTAAHALSTGERGISGKFKGVSNLEMMAETLRCLGQGTKVCFEIAVMALEADAIPYGKPVVCCGGTHRGSDTAAVVTPCYSACILETVMNEILCKPFDPSNSHIDMSFK